jgi:hypothetical protein
MFDAHHRRSAVQWMSAAAAAVIAAPDLVSDTEARSGKHRLRRKPIQIFRGAIENPVYTRIGGAGSNRYLIEAGDCSGRMRNCERNDARNMSASRLFSYLERKSGGTFTGRQTFTLGGVTWRLDGVMRDPEDGHWRIRAHVCESNPDARPRMDQPAAEGRATTVGCDCGCNSSCYLCGDRYRCGSNYEDAGLAR